MKSQIPRSKPESVTTYIALQILGIRKKYEMQYAKAHLPGPLPAGIKKDTD